MGKKLHPLQEKEFNFSLPAGIVCYRRRSAIGNKQGKLKANIWQAVPKENYRLVLVIPGMPAMDVTSKDDYDICMQEITEKATQALKSVELYARHHQALEQVWHGSQSKPSAA